MTETINVTRRKEFKQGSITLEMIQPHQGDIGYFIPIIKLHPFAITGRGIAMSPNYLKHCIRAELITKLTQLIEEIRSRDNDWEVK